MHAYNVLFCFSSRTHSSIDEQIFGFRDWLRHTMPTSSFCSRAL